MDDGGEKMAVLWLLLHGTSASGSLSLAEKMVAMEVARHGGCCCANEEVRWC